VKVTFVQTTNRFFADTQMFGVHFMPVWAYTLASHLRGVSDVEISLFDDRFDDPLDIPAADVFLLTGINQDYDAIASLQASIRQRFQKARLLIGGPISWSYKMAGKIDALAMFDHVVIGDGEEIIGDLIQSIRSGKSLPRVIESPRRFDFARALPMDRELLDRSVSRYYGAVLEVSRGCPFLCEFCDIRVLPDNNRSHNKSPDLIVRELDHLYDLGVRKIRLLTNNPKKIYGLEGFGLEVVERVPIRVQSNPHNERYLRTKKDKLGHLL